MEADILRAITSAADIFQIKHKNMAFAISVALKEVARSRPGAYGMDKARMMALAEEFDEFT